MLLDIHKNIKTKLLHFKKTNKIPNIIFHGPTGSGKKTVVSDFIKNIYNEDNDKLKTLTLSVDCSQGKGIKFIRDELKYFAKSNIACYSGSIFKSIILLTLILQ